MKSEFMAVVCIALCLVGIISLTMISYSRATRKDSKIVALEEHIEVQAAIIKEMSDTLADHETRYLTGCKCIR